MNEPIDFITTMRKKLFASFFITTFFDGPQAAQRAGYTGDDAAMSALVVELLSDPEVQGYIVGHGQAAGISAPDVARFLLLHSTAAAMPAGTSPSPSQSSASHPIETQMKRLRALCGTLRQEIKILQSMRLLIDGLDEAHVLALECVFYGGERPADAILDACDAAIALHRELMAFARAFRERESQLLGVPGPSPDTAPPPPGPPGPGWRMN